MSSCKRNNLDIICVVLGCDTKKNRTLDSINLINYIFNNFTIINVKDIITKNFESWKLQNSNSFSVNKGVSSDLDLDLYLNEEQIPYNNLAINKKSIDLINTPISFETNFEAPLLKNCVIGTMNINIDNKTLFSLQILNRNAIDKKSNFYYLYFFTKNYFHFFS